LLTTPAYPRRRDRARGFIQPMPRIRPATKPPPKVPSAITPVTTTKSSAFRC
jgi:hypothetical protein